jgi:hypothetical protein
MPARPLSFSVLVYAPAPSPAKLGTMSFDDSICRHLARQVHQPLCVPQCPMQAYHPQCHRPIHRMPLRAGVTESSSSETLGDDYVFDLGQFDAD